MRFGKIIRRARTGKKYSQQALGERIDVWGTYIGQIEKGTRVPADDRCEQLAKALDLNPQKLLISAYKERAETRQTQRLFTQMEKLMTDPVISQMLADSKMLDGNIVKALQSSGIRKILKNTQWREALDETASSPDRDIPELLKIINQIPPQQWEVLVSTAKAFAGLT